MKQTKKMSIQILAILHQLVNEQFQTIHRNYKQSLRTVCWSCICSTHTSIHMGYVLQMMYGCR